MEASAQYLVPIVMSLHLGRPPLGGIHQLPGWHPGEVLTDRFAVLNISSFLDCALLMLLLLLFTSSVVFWDHWIPAACFL